MMTYFDQLEKAYSTYQQNVEIADRCIEMEPRCLIDALEASKELERVARRIKKRTNVLLGIALDICGLEKKKGHWSANFEGVNLPTYSSRMHNEFHEGKLSFILSCSDSSAWKGNIKQCPLFKLMPLTFPVRWLDMPTSRVKKEMSDLWAHGKISAKQGRQQATSL